MDKQQILDALRLFSLRTGGIGSWLTDNTDDEVFARLGKLDKEPLTRAQLNELLVFGHEAPVSDDFFRYYWTTAPPAHPYDVKAVSDFQQAWERASAITSLKHLKWGLYRFYTDALLWFGNVRTAYHKLRAMTSGQLSEFYARLRYDSQLMKERGPAIPLQKIAKDDRYLIAEKACKSYGGDPSSPGALKQALLEAWRSRGSSGEQITIRKLLEGDYVRETYANQQKEFIFSADDVLDQPIESEADIEEKYAAAAQQFFKARDAALRNTRRYLSMVGELDVYVATSMGIRQNYRDMADVCEEVFADSRLKDLHLRYFDPTLSAAEGHEDKGLIECLMVKCAKALVYCAGESASYGKDAEAAMGLSLGKPVIFYCDSIQRHRFYRDVHPLSRLIEFDTGVAVGAIVTDKLEEVSELLYRIFENRMEYELEQPKPDYLRLNERLTRSVVRLQTNDTMLSETFWNYYHNRPGDPAR